MSNKELYLPAIMYISAVAFVLWIILRLRLRKKHTVRISKDSIYIDNHLFCSRFDPHLVALAEGWKPPLLARYLLQKFHLHSLNEDTYRVGIVSSNNSIVLVKGYDADQSRKFAAELAGFLGTTLKVVKKIKPGANTSEEEL